MKISQAMGRAFRLCFSKPYEWICFTLAELCLTLACFTPLLFLTTERLKFLALLCIPFYLLVMLWARVNAAGVMQDALAGGSLLSVHLLDPEDYGKKLCYGLSRALLLLLWGAPLIAGAVYARSQIAGKTDAFTLLRAIKAFGGGELMQGGIYLLACLVGDFMSVDMMTELSLIGGFLIASSGISILRKNLLPKTRKHNIITI